MLFSDGFCITIVPVDESPAYILSVSIVKPLIEPDVAVMFPFIVTLPEESTVKLYSEELYPKLTAPL